MDFLIWHYSTGLQNYVGLWMHQVDWTAHYFSPGLLIRTLFAPWKKLSVSDDKSGFNFGRAFETFTFNLISRIMGFVVRSALLAAGLLSILFTFLASMLAILFWIVFPPLGLMIYANYQKRPSRIARKTHAKAKSSKNKLKIILDSEPGRFVLAHLNVNASQLIDAADNEKVSLTEETPKSFTEIVEHLVNEKVWTKSLLQKIGLVPEDIVSASQWWDTRRSAELHIDKDFGRPGIGLELLHGYTPNLNQYSVDLSSPKSYSHHLIGREQVVSQMERYLTADTSVLLQGQPGVGKRTVVMEFAHRASSGKLGQEMSYRRILELDHNSLLAESSDLNDKKSKLSLILKEAAHAGNIILMVRDLHRLTNKEVEGYDFTDVIEDHLEKGDLKIIAVTTHVEYERFIAGNMRLRKHFEVVDVNQPTKDEAMKILLEFASSAEVANGVTIPVPVLRKILEESDRFITEIPYPEKALELLDAVIMYRKQEGGDIVSTDDAAHVLSEKVGVSFAALSGAEKKKLANLEEIIHERLVGQDASVKLIARSLRARTVGVAKEGKPIGSFLFLGPTGVGKTETAKVLANVYFGSEESIIRFDMAEYAGREGLERLIGDVSRNQPGVLTTSIKNNPASLLLLDEIEKSPKEIFNLFLSLLDEGKMKDAFDKTINGRNLFIIGTSNAGAEFIRTLVAKGVKGEDLQNKVIEHVLENHYFSPEFLNRFDAVVVYEPLGVAELIKIANLLARGFTMNLRKKGINVEFATGAIEQIANDGFDPAFGARPMQRVLDLTIGDMISKALLSDKIIEGDTIRILPGGKKNSYKWEKVTIENDN